MNHFKMNKCCVTSISRYKSFQVKIFFNSNIFSLSEKGSSMNDVTFFNPSPLKHLVVSRLVYPDRNLFHCMSVNGHQALEEKLKIYLPKKYNKICVIWKKLVCQSCEIKHGKLIMDCKKNHNIYKQSFITIA